MTTSTLHSTILHLASQFAGGILEAIRGASLEDILAETSGGRRPGRPPRAAAFPEGVPGGGAKSKGGRLARRSAGDIASLVSSIVTLLEGRPNGMRAEEIRAELGLEAKELPRPIADALSSRRVVKRGQKRATTYFARGGGGRTASKPARAAKKASTKGSKTAKAGSGRKGKKKGAGGGAAAESSVSRAV